MHARAQTDKKNLGAKAMLAEIKDVVEKRRAAEASALSALSSAAPFGSRLHPDLVFDYRDRCAAHGPHSSPLCSPVRRRAPPRAQHASRLQPSLRDRHCCMRPVAQTHLIWSMSTV